MDLAAAAAIAIPAIAAAIGPQAIVWFGSAVTGKTHEDSDLDFLIIAPRDAGTRKDLLRRARRSIWRLPVPVDLFVFYPEEVAARRDAVGNVVHEALQTGRVVHGHV